MKTIAKLLQWAAKQLTDSESPKLDAEVILCFLLEKDRSYLFTWDDKVMGDDIISRFS
ncbi:MAG: release factor glutamine methyltransferase, partial [Moritella dasanensis]